MNNLLIHLHRWVSRQDENFTTESLAHLLKHLRDHEPDVAARLLTKMTDNCVIFEPEEMRLAQITTQVTTVEGRPDIEIGTANSLVYVEAKVESGLGRDQLERYRKGLEGERKRLHLIRTALVLLTRYPILTEAIGGEPDAVIRWHHIGTWLLEERSKTKIIDPVSQYLVDQLLGYLNARGMIMEAVTWEIVRGARTFRDLMLMLGESAKACKLSSIQAYGFDYFGYNLDRSRYFLGVRYDNADKIVFSTKKVHLDTQVVKELAIGSVWERKNSPGGWAWENRLDLSAEDVHFFARSLASQKMCLEEFLTSCIEIVKQIEILDPSPVLAESTESDDDGEEVTGSLP